MKESIAVMSRNWSFFKRLVIASLLPGLCAIAMLFFGFFPLSLAAAGKIDRASEQALSARIEQELLQLNAAGEEVRLTVEATKWVHSVWLDYVINEKPISGLMIKEIGADLRTVVMKNQSLSAVSLRYYESTDTLFTSEGVYMNVGWLRRQSDDSMYRFYPETQGLFSVPSGSGLQLYYGTPYRDNPDCRHKGIINAALSTEALEAILQQEQVQQLCICRSDGTQIWSSRPAASAEKCDTVTGSLLSGALRYSYEIPVRLHRQNRLQVERIMLPAILLACAITAVFAYFFTKMNYQPVTEVVNALRETEETDSEKISAAALKELVNGVLQKKQATERKMQRFRPLAQQEMLGAILSGEAFLREFGSAPAEYDLTFPEPYFAVLALEYPQSDARSGILPFTELPAVSMEGLCAYVYRNYFGKYMILVNFSDPDQFDRFIASLKSEFEANTDRRTVHCGVGERVDQLKEVYRSAEQATVALNYAVMNCTAEYVRWAELAAVVSSEYSYSFSDEMMLSMSICSGDKAGSREIVQRIVNQNILPSQNDPGLVKRLYYDIRSTVFRSGQRKGLPADAITDDAPAPQSFPALVAEICRQIDEICDAMTQAPENAGDGKDAEIFAYVEQNLFDPGLSLVTISTALGVSKAYISGLFKRKRNINYADYVNRKRIEKALEIIAKEHPSACSLYQRVGYVSESTFRRNFTKYTQKNPGDYQKT